MNRLLLLLLLSVALVSCTHRGMELSDDPDDRLALKLAAESHQRLLGILERCRAASRVEIFEGLPHPRWERESLVKESQRADTFENHDFRFYSPAMPLPLSQRRQLLSRVLKDSNYRQWQGYKLCGGFHPDFLVRFHCVTGIIDLHLCFGCAEAEFFENGIINHVNLKERVSNFLERLQKANRMKRPPWRL